MHEQEEEEEEKEMYHVGSMRGAFTIINISPFITSTDYAWKNVTDYHFQSSSDRSIYDFSHFSRSIIHRVNGKGHEVRRAIRMAQPRLRAEANAFCRGN